MKVRPLLFRAAALCALAAPLAAADRVEVRDGKFHVDGRPFFVRAVGYAGWRPHQAPDRSYVLTNRRWTKLDFRRIKAAHFNTIRTWEALDPEELKRARAEGLMVLQGIWLDPHQNFADAQNGDVAVRIVETVARQSKPFDNILGYLLMTEPSPAAVAGSGAAETQQFFRRLKRAIQAIDPRPVAADGWAPLAFLDYGEFDFVAFNAYPYWPASLIHSLGYPGYVRWLADHLAGGRPLIVTATGGYAVSRATAAAPAAPGPSEIPRRLGLAAFSAVGGLPEYDQSARLLESLRGAVQGHAWGSALVGWIDPWHYPSDPGRHDDNPWEWTGLVGIPTDRRRDLRGIPRQAYRDVGLHNLAIPLEPRADHFYPLREPVPISVFTAEPVARLQVSLNDGHWHPVDGPGPWWQASVRLPPLARKRQKLSLRAFDRGERLLLTKEISFLTAVAPEQLSLQPAGTAGRPEFRVVVRDGEGRPLRQRRVHYGFFYPVSLREAQGTAQTNAEGELLLRSPLAPMPEDRTLFVAAGTDSPERVRTGELRIFPLNP